MGWMILDKDDPSKIVARAEHTLLHAELPFETTGTNATGPLQTNWVVFTDGLEALGNDEFIVYYGGGDTVVGAAKIKVTVPTTTTTTPHCCHRHGCKICMLKHFVIILIETAAITINKRTFFLQNTFNGQK